MSKKRIGARSMKDLSPEILSQLNEGCLETVNLTEWLAVDQLKLLNAFLKNESRLAYLTGFDKEISHLKKVSAHIYNQIIGRYLLHKIKEYDDSALFDIMSSHISDTIRCWASYIIGYNEDLALAEKFEQIKRFASDKHFGVREIAWMSIRSDIICNVNESIQILTTWTHSDDENVRRFACESTRPRGVWCQHIELLKNNPEQGMPILSSIKADKSKYVRDSVANWLNDVSKSNPDFVKKTCEEWKEVSPCKETDYIICRALRTINK